MSFNFSDFIIDIFIKIETIRATTNKPAKIIINTDSSGSTEEVVPAADQFVLEIDHFNKVIRSNLLPKLTNEDALWNSKTLEAIQKSIHTDNWIDI